MIKKKTFLSKSFTLIELLVVIGIVIIVALLGLINYQYNRQIKSLDNETEKFASLLREARRRALTGQTIEGIRPKGFGVYLQLTATSYSLFADKNNNGAYDSDEEISRFDLPSKIYFQNFIGQSFIFTLPNGEYTGGEKRIVLALENSDRSRAVILQSPNRIEIEGPSSSSKCSTDADCSSGEKCCSGYCRKVCFDDSDCDDGDSCTRETCENSGSCSSYCSYTRITDCYDDDGCCPPGCTSLNDNDCVAHCGDGICEESEKCECEADCDGSPCPGGYCCGKRCQTTIENSDFDETCRSGPFCLSVGAEKKLFYLPANEGNVCLGTCLSCHNGFCNFQDNNKCTLLCQSVCQADGSCANTPLGEEDTTGDSLCQGNLGCSGEYCRCDGSGNCLSLMCLDWEEEDSSDCRDLKGDDPCIDIATCNYKGSEGSECEYIYKLPSHSEVDNCCPEEGNLDPESTNYDVDCEANCGNEICESGENCHNCSDDCSCSTGQQCCSIFDEWVCHTPVCSFDSNCQRSDYPCADYQCQNSDDPCQSYCSYTIKPAGSDCPSGKCDGLGITEEHCKKDIGEICYEDSDCYTNNCCIDISGGSSGGSGSGGSGGEEGEEEPPSGICLDFNQPCCGNLVCEDFLGENYDNCPADCQALWYYPDFARRLKINIDLNNTSESLTDFVVRIDVGYDTDMQPDFDDIRFTSVSGSIETTEVYSYWREENYGIGGSVFWVKIPQLNPGSNEIYMYYGNPFVSTTSNIESTFVFADDFNGRDLNTSQKWNKVGSPYVKNGQLRLIGQSGVKSKTDFQYKTLEFWGRFENELMNDAFAGFNLSSFDFNQGPCGAFQPDGSSPGVRIVYQGEGCEGDEGESFLGGDSAFDNDYHRFKIEWQDITGGEDQKFYLDDNLVFPSEEDRSLSRKIAFYAGDGASLDIDWVILYPSLPEEASLTVSPSPLDYSLEESYFTYSPGSSECSDGIDNNKDGLIDLDDPGCSDAEDDSENTLTDQRCFFKENSSENEDCINSPDSCGACLDYLDLFSKRRLITITNRYKKALFDFPVKITVDYDSAMRTDFADVRFLNREGTEQLAQWIQKPTSSSSATFWVKIPYLPPATDNGGKTYIYMYYGSDLITDYYSYCGENGNLCSIDSVFSFGDDFDKPSDKWNQKGVVYNSSGTITLDPGSEMISKESDFQFLTLDFRAKLETANTNSWLGFSTQEGCRPYPDTCDSLWGGFVSTSGPTDLAEYLGSGGKGEVTESLDLGTSTPGTDWHIFEIKWLDDESQSFYLDGAPLASSSHHRLVPRNLVFLNNSSSGTSSGLEIDWVFLRKDIPEDYGYSIDFALLPEDIPLFP